MTLSESRKPDGGVRVILCTIAYRDKLLERALEMAGRAGFDGVELWGREPHLPETFDETRMRATKKLLQAHSVAPYVLGSYLRLGATKDDGIELADTLHIARWLRTPLVRVWASDVGSAEASEEVWRAVVDDGRNAADRAAKLDLTLVVEMHAGTVADTAEGAVRLMQEVGRDNFRLNYQVSAHDDGQSPEERLQATLPWVSHVHAQNYETLAGQPADPVVRAPLASGVVKYEPLVSMLKDAGYRGCLAVEFAHDEQKGREEALTADAAFLRSICG